MCIANYMHAFKRCLTNKIKKKTIKIFIVVVIKIKFFEDQLVDVIQSWLVGEVSVFYIVLS